MFAEFWDLQKVTFTILFYLFTYLHITNCITNRSIYVNSQCQLTNFNLHDATAHSEPCQASKIEISVKIVNGFRRLYNALYLVIMASKKIFADVYPCVKQ